MAAKLSVNQKEGLIVQVEEHEHLYNPRHKWSKDMERRDNAWKSIAAHLDITFKQAKTAWTNIRDAYLRNKKTMKTKSGQSAAKKKPYQFAQQLEFLEIYITQDEEDETVSNLSQSVLDEEEDEEEVDESQKDDTDEEEGEAVEPRKMTSRPTTSTPSQEKVKRGRKRPKDVVGGRIMEYLETRSKDVQVIPPPPVRAEKENEKENEDPDKLFLLSLLPDLKVMGRRAKSGFKIKVLQAIEDTMQDDGPGEIRQPQTQTQTQTRAPEPQFSAPPQFAEAFNNSANANANGTIVHDNHGQSYFSY